MRSQLKSRFHRCHEITEREVGRPRLVGLRKNPLVVGQLEYIIQPIYDFYGVAVATATTLQTLFAQPRGANYTPAGGTQFVKTLYHTNLVQPGQLDAPKKMLVKNIAVLVRGDIAPQDLASFTGNVLCTFSVTDKVYWQAMVSKCPAGGGPYGFYVSTQTLAGGGTMANLGANGWPTAQNVAPIVEDFPQIPGLAAMQPITGVLIEQQQNFKVDIDPTLTGAAAFTTLAAAPATQFVGTGVNSHTYLEGVLARAIL